MKLAAEFVRELAKMIERDGALLPKMQIAGHYRAHADALEELERLKAPVEGEIAEVVRDAVALVSLWPSVRQLQDGFMNGDPKFTRWDHDVRDESIRLSPAIGRIAETIERLAARDSALSYFTKLAQRGELEAISRAERAEAALAECLAKLEVDPRTKYDGIDCRDETIRMLEKELEESARLHGMGASREAALQARLAESERKCERLKFHAEAMREILLAQLVNQGSHLYEWREETEVALASHRAEFKEES